MTTPVPLPCLEWAEMLTATHPGDLSPEQQAALDTHLATCPACAAVRADYLRLDAYIQRLPTSRPLPAFPPQLLADGAVRRAGRRNASGAGYRLGERASAPRLISQQQGPSILPPGRIRNVAALVSLAAIVALFVAVFHGFTPGHPGQSSTSSGPTSIPAGQWTAIPGLTNQAALPIIAPSNPNIVYELSYPQDAPNQVTIQRSDNDGASWQKLPLPSGNLPPIDVPSLAVSPIDASTVFLTLATRVSAHPSYRCSAAQASTGAIDALIHLSGGASCSAQYISSDGGQHWSRIQLPFIGAIGAPYFLPIFTSISTDGIHAQGQRLYAALGESNLAGTAVGALSQRIVASDDGGKTWKLVDEGVSVSGQFICDFTAAPTGSTLFAIAQTGGTYCYSDPTITDHLWRSDDGGKTWDEVGKLPDIASNMLVVSRGAGEQPLLYMHMPGAVEGGSLQPSNKPPELEVSADGGKTWHKAPTRGLPAGTTTSYGPLGVLSNDSILQAFLTPDQTLTLSTWKAGNGFWQPLAQHITQNVAYLLALSNDGKTTLWLVSQSADSSHVPYTVQRYDLK